MEKPSFKQVIVINGFSLHQNSTNVNIIFEEDGWWTRKQKRKESQAAIYVWIIPKMKIMSAIPVKWIWMRMKWPISCRIPTITARIFRWGMSTRLCASRCSGTGNEDCFKEKTVHMMMQMVHHIGSLLTYTSELCSVHKQYT